MPWLTSSFLSSYGLTENTRRDCATIKESDTRKSLDDEALVTTGLMGKPLWGTQLNRTKYQDHRRLGEPVEKNVNSHFF